MLKRTGWGFTIVAAIIAFSIWLLTIVPIERGIDLQGGTELTYALDLSRIEGDRGSIAEDVKDTIAKRLNAYGLKEVSVSVQGVDQLVVQVPGTETQSVEHLKRQIQTAGNLMFRLKVTGTEYENPARIEQLREQERVYNAEQLAWVERNRADPSFNGRRPKPPDFIVRYEVEKNQVTDRFETKPNSETVLLNRHEENPETNTWEPVEMVSGRYLSSVMGSFDENSQPAVAFQFKGEGAAAFADLTGNHIDEPLAIVLDDDIMNVANIKSRISGSGQLSGDYTDQDVKGIVTILRGGSLPTKPILVSESTVGSVLGQDSIEAGLKAVLYGVAGVFLIMALYYLAGGLVANFALALNLLLIVAFVACFHQTLTLPGIAGMLLTLAMAVDANILIFERFREERKKGKPPVQALTAAYQRAFWVIFDSNLTTVITGYVLFYMGTGPVKGFAVTLITGIFASFFTAVFVTRLLLSFLFNSGILKDVKMFQAFDTPRVPFTQYQRPFLIGSVILVAVTWVLVVFRGADNYGIDFTGGARITMSLSKPVAEETLRQKIDELALAEPDLFRDYSLQTLEAEDSATAKKYALLTRAGSATATADAQEPPKTPSPRTAPSSEAGAKQGAAAEAEIIVEPAQKVKQALARMLEGEGWLLPQPYPKTDWSRLTQPGALPGSVALTMEVNLVDSSPGTTTDSIRNEINKSLDDNELLSISAARTDGAYKGVQVETVELVGHPDLSANVKITRYRITTSGYQPPLPAAALGTNVPTQIQVEDGIRTYFRTMVSEPFPQVSTVGPRVASSLQADALVAVFLSMLGIIFYLSLRFEFIYGVAGIVALVHDVMVAIGMMALVDMLLPTTFPVKLNLNELAAVLTIIGFSINDSIVLFDRIRENTALFVRRKLKLVDIVNISINQTLARTLWTSLTTLLVTVMLLAFGGEGVRGFAFVFAVGTVAGTYSSVFVAAPVAIWLNDRSLARRGTPTPEPAKA
jgi:SecD/SecF fusion protein